MIKFDVSYLIPLLTPVVFSRMAQDPFLFPKQTVFVALCGLTFFALLLRLVRTGEQRTLGIQFSDASIAAMLLLSVASLYRTPNFYVTLESVTLVISACVYYFYLKTYSDVFTIFGKHLGLFAVSSLGATIYAFFQYYRADFLFEGARDLDKMRLFSFFGNKNYLSEFLVIIFFVILARIALIMASARSSYFPRKAGAKAALAFYSASLLLTSAMIYLLQSRASFLALAGGCVIAAIAVLRSPSAFAAVRSRRAFVAAALVLCVLGAALYTFRTPIAVDTTDIFERLGSIFDVSGQRNISMRLDIWNVTARMIRDRFWLGCGLAYFKMHYLDYQGILLREGKNRFYENQFFAKANQAHNEFLQIFCELGFIGFLAFFALIVFVFVRLAALLRFYSAARSPARFAMCVCLASSFFSAVINSMFGFPLHILPTAALLTALLAAFDRLSSYAPLKRQAPPLFYSEYPVLPKKINIVAVMLFVAVFYALVFAAIPGYVAANSCLKAGLDLVKLNRPEEALPYLQRSVSINRFNGEARYYLGICYMQRREYDRAIIEFIQALDTESDPNIYSNIGLSYYKIGMYPEALDYLKKALAISPTDIYYLLNAGCAEQRMRNFDSALAYFRRAQSFASTPEALVNTGHVYLLMNMPESGAAVLYDAVGRYGRDGKYAPKIHFLLGLCLGESKKYAEAVSQIKQALEFHPDNNEYLINMGLYQIFDGRTAEAELTLRKAISRDFDALAAYNLANLYFNSSRPKDALILLARIKSFLEEKGGAGGRLYSETLGLIDHCRR